MSHNFTIAQTWEGVLVQPEDRVHVDIAIWNNDRLQIEIIAPFLIFLLSNKNSLNPCSCDGLGLSRSKS